MVVHDLRHPANSIDSLLNGNFFTSVQKSLENLEFFCETTEELKELFDKYNTIKQFDEEWQEFDIQHDLDEGRKNEIKNTNFKSCHIKKLEEKNFVPHFLKDFQQQNELDCKKQS